MSLPSLESRKDEITREWFICTDQCLLEPESLQHRCIDKCDRLKNYKLHCPISYYNDSKRWLKTMINGEATDL